MAGQASSMERQCSRLERDLEEGSRRLAMAHNEIRRLTDELESAHLTQRAYGERKCHFKEISHGDNASTRCHHYPSTCSFFICHEIKVATSAGKENITNFQKNP